MAVMGMARSFESIIGGFYWVSAIRADEGKNEEDLAQPRLGLFKRYH
jgi:hypothetical protein